MSAISCAPPDNHTLPTLQYTLVELYVAVSWITLHFHNVYFFIHDFIASHVVPVDVVYIVCNTVYDDIVV